MNLEVIKGKTEFAPEQARYQGERLDVLDAHFRRLYEKDKIVSSCYSLSRDGKLFANNASGDFSWNKEDGRAFQPDSIFRICSITKVFTAIAILKLCEDGLMRLDQPVGDFLPEFKKPPFGKVTVMHLLNHTSGITPDGGTLPNDYYLDWYELVDENDIAGTWISAICKCGLRREPGDEWCYCTTGFALLGEIITRVSGTDCHEYIEKNICAPCEMTDTSFVPMRDRIERYAHTWDWQDEMFAKIADGTFEQREWHRIVPRTGGGLYSTTNDLVKFGNMILNNGVYNGKRIIGRKALEALRRPTTERSVRNFAWDNGGAYKCYGTGIDIWTWDDKAQLLTPGVINHEGFGPSCLMIDVEENFVAVWACPFRDPDNWFAESLRNVSSIIWSGLE